MRVTPSARSSRKAASATRYAPHARSIANPSGVAVVRVTLSGFDTHSGQTATQARLLGDLARGIDALKSALTELGRWNDTLVLTYAEFGRRPRENLSNGTDHGTANVQFALGGRVAGGFYGERLRSIGSRAMATRPSRSISEASTRPCSRSGGASPHSRRLGASFAPVPFVKA